MNFIYLSLPEDANSYLKEKLLNGSANGEATGIISNIIEQSRKNIDLPKIASESDFYNVDKKQMKLINVAKRCATQSIFDVYPMGADEEIEEDFFSYLTSPWHDLPAQTAVLKRKTNKSEVIYFFDFVQIDKNGIVYLPITQPEDEPYIAARGLTMSVVSKFMTKALKFAGPKIGSAVMEKLGAVVMNLVMKELFGVDGDADRIIKEVRKIIKEEIEENEISRVTGTIDGTIQYILVEYYNKRRKLDLKNRDRRAELETKLLSFSNKFYTDVIGFLRQDKYAERGLKTFAFGATIHLLLTQELALIDPDEMDPNESSYLETLRNNARNYKAHVQGVYNRAIAARNNLSVFSEESVVDNGTRYIRSVQWYWRDGFLNKRHGPYGPAKNPDRTAYENAHYHMEQYRTKVLAETREALGHPQETFLSAIDGLINFSFPK